MHAPKTGVHRLLGLFLKETGAMTAIFPFSSFHWKMVSIFGSPCPHALFKIQSVGLEHNVKNAKRYLYTVLYIVRFVFPTRLDIRPRDTIEGMCK